MRYVAIFLVVLRDHPILSLLAIVLLGFSGGVLPQKWRKYQIAFVSSLALIWFGNLFLGSFMRNLLIENYGAPGAAMVVKTTQTANQYNDQPVMRCDVMLKPQNAPAVLTHFMTWDFNVVHTGSWNGCTYPWEGVKFNVRYLPEYPRAFVIIANDHSEYSEQLRANKLAEEISSLQYQLKMDPQNAQVKAKLEELMRQPKREP